MTDAASRVSVIVPCHNAAPYLAQAIDSLLAQTSPPWEVIVVDDGSDDGSAAIVGRYGPPVRGVSQPRQGIAGARNRGLELADGDLIAFLDADDLWPQDSLGIRLRRLAAEPDLDGVFGIVEGFISPDLPETERFAMPAPPPPQQSRLAGSLLLRWSLVDAVGRFDSALTVGETMDWVARADALGVRIAAVDGVVLRRRIHRHNTMRGAEQLQSNYLRLLRSALARRRSTQPVSPDGSEQ